MRRAAFLTAVFFSASAFAQTNAEVRTRMQAAAADPAGNTPEEFARFIRDDQAKWSRLMREAGIKPE
jgi:tripartite-type tricarboxylate transporter receptor subunit TctC